MPERLRPWVRRCALLLVAWLHAAWAADSGEVPLHRVHTGDLGMLIAVDVAVGETRGRWLVDTGATHHLVSPAFAARQRWAGKGSVRADTPFGRFDAPQVDLPPLAVGALALPGQRALVLDLVPIAGAAADGIDGVLGAPWLETLALDLDLRRWTLRVQEPDEGGCPAGQVALPVARHQGLPVVEIRVDDGPAERALLDTGNAGSLVRIDGLFAPQRSGVDVPGLPAVAARAAAVRIGALERREVPVTFLRSPALRRVLAADVGALAGMALLEGARLRLEVGRGRLCLEPGERRLPGGFGLVVDADADGWVVGAVYAGSPAAQAGLRAGDRLRRWDGGAPPASLDAAWAALHGRDELSVVVERGGAERPLTLRRAWFLPPLR